MSFTSYLWGRNFGITHFFFSSFRAVVSFRGDRRARSPETLAAVSHMQTGSVSQIWQILAFTQTLSSAFRLAWRRLFPLVLLAGVLFVAGRWVTSTFKLLLCRLSFKVFQRVNLHHLYPQTFVLPHLKWKRPVKVTSRHYRMLAIFDEIAHLTEIRPTRKSHSSSTAYLVRTSSHDISTSLSKDTVLWWTISRTGFSNHWGYSSWSLHKRAR